MDTPQTLGNLRTTLRAVGVKRWPEVAKLAKVSRPWISTFVSGGIDNPGVKTLAKVRRALELLPADPPRKRGGLTSARKKG